MKQIRAIRNVNWLSHLKFPSRNVIQASLSLLETGRFIRAPAEIEECFSFCLMSSGFLSDPWYWWEVGGTLEDLQSSVRVLHYGTWHDKYKDWAVRCGLSAPAWVCGHWCAWWSAWWSACPGSPGRPSPPTGHSPPWPPVWASPRDMIETNKQPQLWTSSPPAFQVREPSLALHLRQQWEGGLTCLILAKSCSCHLVRVDKESLQMLCKSLLTFSRPVPRLGMCRPPLLFPFYRIAVWTV